MKKIIYSLLTIIFAFAFNSCEMDVDPTNAVNRDAVFENANSADNVLNGTWSYLWDTYYSYQNPGFTSLLLASDAMGNDAALQPGKYGYLAHYSFTAMSSSSASTVNAIWTFTYKAIDNTNSLITQIDNVPGDEDQKARIKAQAQALRGYLYLNLVTFYNFAYAKDSTALSVPIYTEPSTKETVGQPRSQIREVYRLAESDLLAAYNNLGTYNRGEMKYKMDKNVVAGLLARLYLQTNRWAQAQKYANEAQAKYNWMSKEEYLRGFNDYNNAEWIWGHGQTTDQRVASYSFNYKDVSSKSSFYYSFMADPYFKDLFNNDANDTRFNLFEWDRTRFKGGLMYKKFLFRSNGTADIVLMRKAEQVLIEAEAFAELNQSAQAIDKLNELRTQRGASTPNLTSLSKQQLIEEILIERRKELFGEGFALSDILRRQKAVERKEVPAGTLIPGNDSIKMQGHTITKLPNGGNFVPNSTYYLFSIPETESTNNPNL